MPIAELETKSKVKTKKPSMCNVILYNDDLTPFEFVEAVLSQIFKKQGSDVMRIAQEAHNNGTALVGVYTREVATSRCMLTKQLAKESGFPLKVEPKEIE